MAPGATFAELLQTLGRARADAAAWQDYAPSDQTTTVTTGFVSAEDVSASLLGIFTVAGKPENQAQAGRLLDLLMDGLRPRPPGS